MAADVTHADLVAFCEIRGEANNCLALRTLDSADVVPALRIRTRRGALVRRTAWQVRNGTYRLRVHSIRRRTDTALHSPSTRRRCEVSAPHGPRARAAHASDFTAAVRRSMRVSGCKEVGGVRAWDITEHEEITKASCSCVSDTAGSSRITFNAACWLPLPPQDQINSTHRRSSPGPRLSLPRNSWPSAFVRSLSPNSHPNLTRACLRARSPTTTPTHAAYPHSARIAACGLAGATLRVPCWGGRWALWRRVRAWTGGCGAAAAAPAALWRRELQQEAE